MSYPIQFRELVIKYRRNGHTLKETSEHFEIAACTISAWEKLLKEKGSLEKKKLNRTFKKIDPERLKKHVKDHPDDYQSVIAKEFNCTAWAIGKALKRLKITRKKKTIRYREQDQEKVEAYCKKISEFPKESIVYIDETGIDTFLYKEYGYAPRGERVYEEIRGRRYQRTGVVAGLLNGVFVAPMKYNGTMNSSLFEKWFQEWLLPSVPQNTVIVMDNASFHRKKALFTLTEKSGHQLMFLPPYSPELNPIEHYWNWLKRELKKKLPNFSSLDDAICDVFCNGFKVG